MEVGLVRALGNPRETVYYGLEENGGLFEVGIDSGEIAVGSNGPDSLVIVSSIFLVCRKSFETHRLLFPVEWRATLRQFHRFRLLPVGRT